MLFKKTNDLKVGMRLAKPIYNKSGVLLYERNSLLSPQGIESIRNFGLIGVYILEPAEPVPLMTQADLDFERFQTMCVFSIADEMNRLMSTRKQQRTHQIVADIIKNYGRLDKKVNFVQGLRSNEDYIFKHSMNVSILAAMLGKSMNLSLAERNDVVIASLVHDIGKLSLPSELVARVELEKAEKLMVKSATVAGFSLIEEAYPSNPAVKRICTQYMHLREAADKGESYRGDDKILAGARILLIADVFDSLTAMRLEEPPSSEIIALKYLLKNQDVYRRPIIDALINSINILNQGVNVELSNGDKAVVLTENPNDILRPMVLNFRNNNIIDLSNKLAFNNIEIVDVMKTMDNRHVLDLKSIKEQGIAVDEPEFVTPR